MIRNLPKWGFQIKVTDDWQSGYHSKAFKWMRQRIMMVGASIWYMADKTASEEFDWYVENQILVLQLWFCFTSGKNEQKPSINFKVKKWKAGFPKSPERSRISLHWVGDYIWGSADHSIASENFNWIHTHQEAAQNGDYQNLERSLQQSISSRKIMSRAKWAKEIWWNAWRATSMWAGLLQKARSQWLSPHVEMKWAVKKLNQAISEKPPILGGQFDSRCILTGCSIPHIWRPIKARVWSYPKYDRRHIPKDFIEARPSGTSERSGNVL